MIILRHLNIKALLYTNAFVVLAALIVMFIKSHTEDWLSIEITLTALALICVLLLYIIRRITIPLNQIITCFEQIGKGNYQYPIEVRYQDELGTVLAAAYEMQIRLSNNRERELADLSMAYDLIGGLLPYQNTEELINGIIEFLSILFAPQSVNVLIQEIPSRASVLYSQPPTPDVTATTIFLKTLNESHGWLDTENGFFFQLRHHEQILGVIALTNLAMPQYRERYLRLALVIMPVLALMIANVYAHSKHILADERLRQAEARFRAAFDAAAIGMALVDLNGRFTQTNNAMCGICGYSPEEFLQKTFQEITYPEDLDANLVLYNKLIAGYVNDYQMEKRYYHKDGHVVWVWLTVAIVRALNGAPLYFVSQIQDISARKKMEVDLINAKEAAEAVNRAKSTFLANMSHEIRTPMNAVIGLSQLALNQNLAPVTRDYLHKIYSSSQGLLAILNDILDISKTEAGNMSLEYAAFNLDTILDHLNSLFSARVAEKNIKFEINIAARVPRQIIGDALRIQQILTNLLSNAIKFTTHGTVAIHIECKELTDSWVKLLFQIEDTGIGISEQEQSQLFRAFSQANSSITRHFGGTGLGLAISKNLLALMGSV